MTDLALVWDAERFAADLAVAPDSDLASDAGLQTAVLLSLFTDARARPEDAEADPADRRGWWGDDLAEPGDRIGSRLWLLARAKDLPETVRRARGYVEEALAWLIEDGVAASVEADVRRVRPGVLAADVVVVRPGGAASRFSFVWPLGDRS